MLTYSYGMKTLIPTVHNGLKINVNLPVLQIWEILDSAKSEDVPNPPIGNDDLHNAWFIANRVKCGWSSLR